MHPDDKEENIRQWTNALATGNDFVFSHRFKRYDGEYRWQLSRAIPQRDSNGTIQLWVGSSTDIQDMKEMDQQKDNFLSIASHELKTPVTTIKAYGQIAESMLAANGDTKTLGIINKMSIQVNRLTTLIEDLLDMTKIQKDRLMYNETLFDVNELVKEVIDDMQKTSATHEINYTLDKEGEIFGARDKIGQVLNNLISNAIKYSPNSKTINISTELQQDGFHLSVTDFGMGISAKQQQHVFDQFYRVNGDSQSTFPGMGIGLYICSQIMKEQAGKLWVESTVGKGSTFHIWLPLDHRNKTI